MELKAGLKCHESGARPSASPSVQGRVLGARLKSGLTRVSILDNATSAGEVRACIIVDINEDWKPRCLALTGRRRRPESRLAPFLADTGYIAAEDMKSFGIEAAWVNGPWSFQGEYLNNFVSGDQTNSVGGFYVYSSYFLTGESRQHDRRKGIFGRLKPE
jgi:hypothetical protein